MVALLFAFDIPFISASLILYFYEDIEDFYYTMLENRTLCSFFLFLGKRIIIYEKGRFLDIKVEKFQPS